jgi:hypothetical protein
MTHKDNWTWTWITVKMFVIFSKGGWQIWMVTMMNMGMAESNATCLSLDLECCLLKIHGGYYSIPSMNYSLILLFWNNQYYVISEDWICFTYIFFYPIVLWDLQNKLRSSLSMCLDLFIFTVRTMINLKLQLMIYTCRTFSYGCKVGMPDPFKPASFKPA